MSPNASTRQPKRLEPSLALLRQVFEFSTLTSARLRCVLEDFDLTESMAGILWTLDSSQPPVPMRELARRIGCDPSNVTLIGDKRQRAGLVERQPHPSDGRARVLALTDAGRAFRKRLKRLLNCLVATTPLSTLTVSEQQQLSDLLNKLGADD